jgi:formylglycine-generating enzyme required for sulfatase activity
MKKFFLFSFLLLAAGYANANNILVSNATLSNQNTAAHNIKANFDITWDNSWRTSTNENNYDGAWIFIKFRKNGTSDWRHATIDGSSFTAATGAAITVSADNKGVFLYRNADGIGNVSFTANQLQWNYSADGVLDNETVEIRVFAVEMVKIPVGSFLLGSGGTETGAFQNGTSGAPYLVADNNAITVGTAPGNLNTGAYGVAGTIPATFPKGFASFWAMKYECSQQQYVDFLNHIDQARATANNTSGIFSGTHPNLVAPQPERAVGTINTARVAAFADWSGLRPMTELEYEKACRGYNTPAVPNEYAWGNTTFVGLTSVNNAGLANETVNTPPTANANMSSSYGVPVRTGLFARTSGSDRQLSGATYYGMMNMSDNVYEITIFSGNVQGRAVDASVHGDGNLAANGDSDISAWTNKNAYGSRGSSYGGGTAEARVSDRLNSNYPIGYGFDPALANYGFRLVRTQ